MRKSGGLGSEMDELGDLDFNIDITAPPPEEQKRGEEDEHGFQTQTGWVPLGSNPREESSRESFNNSIQTPQAVSMSSEQFRHLHEEGLVDTLFATALNPVACLFHLVFKGSSIFCFLFLNAMLNEEILTFIIVIIFAAFDFWTVKNITGRLLVNMRWDSYIDKFGNEVYTYESDETRKNQEAAAMAGDVEAQQSLERSMKNRVGKTDSHIFWTATYSTPAIWGLLFLSQFFKLNFFWMVIAGVCFSLSFTNAQGFYYCQRSHTERLKEYIQERGLSMFREATRSSLMPSFLSNVSLPSFLKFGGGDSK